MARTQINKNQEANDAAYLQGLAISTNTPNQGDVLVWNPTTASWNPNIKTRVRASAGVPASTLGTDGDLCFNTSVTPWDLYFKNLGTWSLWSPNSYYIRGKLISTTAPTDGQYLKYDAGTSSWIPVSMYVAVPASSSSAGTLGQRAVDTANNFIYECIATNTWVRYDYNSFITVARTYVSDGDTNGVFYYLGTNLGTETWTNPFTAGRLGITSNPAPNTSGDTFDKLVDRTTARCDLGSSSSTPYYQFDLGATRTLVCNKFSFRFRPDDTAYSPTGWKLQGSKDGISFTTLLTVTGATAGLGTWKTDTVTGSVAYRYFRFMQTSTTNGTNFFAAGEVELYGSLIM